MNNGEGNEEGYITIATNKQKYLEMALNLALSIKLKDKKRPIALMHDKNIKIPEEYKKHFSHIIQIKNKDLLKYHMNKLLLYKYSPFEKTMFIDADSLMIKKDINTIWKKLKKYNFTVMGEKLKEGQKCFLDVKKMMDKFSIPYLVDFNAGVMYFDKSNISKNVFRKVWEYRKDKFFYSSKYRGAEIYEEPLIGAAMGHFNLEPVLPAYRNFFRRIEWMACVYGEILEMDIFKSKIRFFITHLQSPTIAHFMAISFFKTKTEHKRFQTYVNLSNKLRGHFGVELLEPEDLYKNEKRK